MRVDKWTLDNGRCLEKGIIEHPGAVVLIPFQPPDTILMLRQYRTAFEQEILELPAGTRHWDEAWLHCAQRELREETGHRAESFTSLGEIWPAPGVSTERMCLYLATGLTPDPLPQDVDEQITLTPMPLTKLVTMAQDGRLQDAKSIVGILRTAVYLQNATTT